MITTFSIRMVRNKAFCNSTVNDLEHVIRIAHIEFATPFSISKAFAHSVFSAELSARNSDCREVSSDRANLKSQETKMH